MNECRKKTMNNLDEDSDEDNDKFQHTWELESNTPSEESWDEGKMNQIYHVYNKASHQTNENTNNTSRMQVENKNRNFTKSRDQSLTMAITADHNMGDNPNKSKASVHQPKSEKDLKYFAGLFTVQIRDGQTDQSIIEYLNTNKILEYHVNTLGRTTHHGNKYTYLGFFTEAAKNDFINDGRIMGTIGKFRDLEWLNKLNKTITISATGIDGKTTDINEVIQAIENKLGKLKNVTQQTGNEKWISMKLEMDIKCTEDELFNTWGVLVKNKMIKIEPMNYKYHIIKQRERIVADILNIPNEIDETTFSKILKTTSLRYWFKTNNRTKGTYNMKIYFNNEEDRKQTISRKIKIDGKNFTWFFQTAPRRQNNFRNERRNDNELGKRFQQEMHDGRKAKRSRCDICKKNNHITDECYFNNRNRTHENRRNRNDNWNEAYRHRKGRYDNEGKFRYNMQQQPFNEHNDNRYNAYIKRGKHTHPRSRFNDNYNRENGRDETRGNRQSFYHQQQRYNGNNDYNNNDHNTDRYNENGNNNYNGYIRDWNEGNRSNDRRRMARRY
ncbi:uncharacterized protein OCT59_002766 [Rhizophagus irregularis]|uniref:uncharacterized protein n=1 Tax=Rhizophagus irregularis TaxID=588596 RepID=UPI00332ABC2D|nr:hypothetical protein OCT59_002766 [Rhizophagus irregularis]